MARFSKYGAVAAALVALALAVPAALATPPKQLLKDDWRFPGTS